MYFPSRYFAPTYFTDKYFLTGIPVTPVYKFIANVSISNNSVVNQNFPSKVVDSIVLEINKESIQTLATKIDSITSYDKFSFVQTLIKVFRETINISDTQSSSQYIIPLLEDTLSADLIPSSTSTQILDFFASTQQLSYTQDIHFVTPSLSSYDSVQQGRWGDVMTVFFNLQSSMNMPFEIQGTPIYSVFDSAGNNIIPPSNMDGWDSGASTQMRGYPIVDTTLLPDRGMYYIVGNFNVSDPSGIIKLTLLSVTMLILN